MTRGAHGDSSPSLAATARDGVITDVKVQDFAVTGSSAGIAEDIDCFGTSVIQMHQQFGASASACRQGSQLKQLGKNM
ncbi:MAG: hypothetical protein WDN50_16905 [Bradyrhizobium sp.]